MSTTAATTNEALDSPSGVLVFARARCADADRAQADVLLAAVTWAEQHPPESIDLAATWVVGGGDTGLPLAGPGAPLVAEFCIAEFAVALGMSTDSGRRLIADAVELKYRLPRVWARVQAGDLASWKGRRIAQATLGLSREAVAFVDAQVAAFAHKIGAAQLDRLVEEATLRFMPDQALENAQKAADGRHLTFHHDQVSFHGTTFVEGELDLADALDLDAVISHGAEQLKLCGATEPLDVRRSMAAGELARKQLVIDLSGTTGGPAERPVTKPRQVVLYVHLSEQAITDASNGLDLARVENHRRGVTADQVRTWCANPDTAVVVKPVIDLDEHVGVDSYEVPDRLREHAELRHGYCAFPWCTRAARRCDCDHVIAYDQGGTTCSCNIAPLCRRHHRLKTHSTWTYTVLEPGSFLWSSPHGYQFLRDHHGTLDVSRDGPPAPTDPPHF
jgi:hypothetical protein